MNKTICELFAGVGGFRLGFENTGADWKTTWFSQWEPGRKKQWAHDCYINHWGDIDCNTGIDISKVDKTMIPDHNLLVGGFPCQNYSVAASKSSKGIEGEKGVLWWQIRDTLIANNPSFVLLENVDRLLKSTASQRGRDFGIMLACLVQLGYRVEWRVVNAAEYGAAQRRRRVFIFGYKKNTNYAKRMDMIETGELIKRKGFFARAFNIEGFGSMKTTVLPYHDISNVSAKQLLGEGDKNGNTDLIEMSNTYEYAFLNSGYVKNADVYTCETSAKVEEPIKLIDILQRDVDERYYIPAEQLEKWVYLKGHKKIERTAKNGHKYIFSEGTINFPDPINKPSRTMLTSEATVNRSTHIVADPSTGMLRLLTPIEAERLQGFDDNWTDTGMPEKFRYFCMGNALVVPMITRMGNILTGIFMHE